MPVPAADSHHARRQAKGSTMSQRVEFENIEEMRSQAGIDDVELRDAVSHLQVGDLVRLTVRTIGGTFPGESLLIRITSIKGDVFRGKLAQSKRSARRSGVSEGTLLAFTRAQIHSIPAKRAGDESS
jgi:hypothetical protein